MTISKMLYMTIIAGGMLIGSCGYVSAQNSSSAHSEAHKNLLASQKKSDDDKVRLIEQNTFIDLIDDIEPELDIYTEGWNSRSVNPFSESDVPETAVIDVTGYYMPHPGIVTSHYGYRKRFKRMHKGIDIGIKSNDTIRAAFDGKVRLTSYERKGYGNYVIIRHPNGLETVYGHLNKHLVKPDQIVKAGDPIGLGGSTGRSTGPHLHFETRFMGYAINPAAIFDFANQTTHTDTYSFSKKTYQNARNYAPAVLASDDNVNTGKKASTKKNSRASKSGQASYTVRKGDTLSAIAKRNGVSVKQLRRINGLGSSDKIRAGQKLKLK